eukprot:COSAG03_NODE_21387_length_304_cov_2.375610_1_plen_56_part_01
MALHVALTVYPVNQALLWSLQIGGPYGPPGSPSQLTGGPQSIDWSDSPAACHHQMT